MAKGISLSIETTVILLLAVLVFATIGFLFSSNLSKGSNTLTVEKAFSDGCNQLFYIHKCGTAPSGITLANFDPDSDGTDGNTLARACELKFGWARHAGEGTSASDCKQACGCPP
ncbi:MAG: hypothetical protein HYY37_02320 [Candidatus Aenigmarchaeota archaeon]|nr:hypothetical protein [Candidatus Aenigmarchaeota archaeon]